MLVKLYALILLLVALNKEDFGHVDEGEVKK